MIGTDPKPVSVLSVPSVVAFSCLNHGGHGEHGVMETE